MKTITKQQLMDWDDTDYDLIRFIDQTNNATGRVAILELLDEQSSNYELLWIAGKLKLWNELRWFTLGCARLVEYLTSFSKNCNDVTEQYLKEKTQKNKKKTERAILLAYKIGKFDCHADSHIATIARSCSVAKEAACCAVTPEYFTYSTHNAAIMVTLIDKNLQPKINELLREVFK